MKARILSFTALILMSGTALSAKKFWEETPFREWSREQISQILSKSPWALQFHVSLNKAQKLFAATGGGATVERAVTGSTRRSIEDVRAQRRPLIAALSRNSGNFDSTGGGFGSYLPLVVRWETALPVKLAFTRLQDVTGSRRMTEGEKSQTLGVPYVMVSVSGLPSGVVPLNPEHERLFLEGVKAHSYLKIRNRPHWTADVVKMLKQQRWVTLYLLFPGEESRKVALKDKKIEFVTKISEQRISRKFKLKDMVFRGKLEL